MPQPPAFDPLSPQPAHPGTALTFTANATPVDPPNSVIQYSLVNPPSGATINASTGVFSWSPAVSQLGYWTVTVQALAADTGLSAQQACAVTVSNQPPTLNPLPDQTAHPGRTLTFTATAADPEGDTLIFSLINPPQGATITNTGQFSWTPNTNQLGAYNITVRVTDPSQAYDQKSCTVTVSNQAPTLNTIGDRTVHPQRTLSFTATATDPDGDTLTFTLVNPPQGAAITSTGQFTWTPNWNQLGAFNVTVRVTDSCGAFDQKSFTVTVTNQAPTLNPLTDRTVAHGTALNFTATATDPDGDSLQWSLVTPPTGAAISPAGVFNWTPQANQVQAWTITIRVTDPGGASDQKQCTITVT